MLRADRLGITTATLEKNDLHTYSRFGQQRVLLSNRVAGCAVTRGMPLIHRLKRTKTHRDIRRTWTTHRGASSLQAETLA